MQATQDSPTPADDRPDTASPESLETAARAARRARKRAQIRLGFIARNDPAGPPPPLARMIRGGRGGKVRLKLLLTYLWMQTDDRGVTLARPAQLWARLLDLEQPETAGARRITEAQQWLVKNNFIKIKSNPGHANAVTVLNETADGTPWVAPGAAAKALSNTTEAAKHYYAQIPATLWTNGYIQLLSGAGLSMFLILLERYALTRAPEPPPVWMSPKYFKDSFALSQDTRAAGMKELEDFNLVTIERKPVDPQDFDLERFRNVYTLHLSQLDQPADRNALFSIFNTLTK
ncbi:hypothetical protein ABZU32_39030 [Sphaerisporangium sp. NPDC005288]|uniref:hypothetical protein n=1 Tax=Sphaerisporangium sp. NPDC005288 TaxID=3155114 RepID=UPI0033AE36AD